VYVRPLTSEEFNFTYPLPLTVLRYTLYPDTVDMLAFQVSATECCTGATPVPDRVTDAGDPVALLAIEMVPFAEPATVGLNTTDRVMLCEGDSVTGALPPVMEYPALKVIDEIVTFALPVLVTVTVCAAEEVPVVMLPKLRLGGLMPSVRTAAIPEPLRGTGVGEVGALLTMEMVPDTEPTTVGTNATVMVVCCPAFTLNGSEKPLTLKAEPDTFTCVMLKVAVPVFLRIKAWEVVVPTTLLLPKLIEVGFG
jgi:hypothetical protein